MTPTILKHCSGNGSKSPLKQEKKPTYSNMPNCKKVGSKCEDYIPTAKDSADYRQGFNKPDRLYTNKFKNSGRIEAMRGSKSPVKQTSDSTAVKKKPYVPGRVDPSVRAAADARKAEANKVMTDRFNRGAAGVGMSPEEYSKRQTKQSKKKDQPSSVPNIGIGGGSGHSGIYGCSRKSAT